MPKEESQKNNLIEPMDLSLIDLIVIFRRYAILIISVSTLFFITSVIYSLSLEKYYRSTLLMIPAEGVSQSQQGLGSLLSGLSGSSSSMNSGISKEEAIAILQSRNFLESFVDEKNYLPKIFSNNWDEKALKWKVDEPTLLDAYSFIAGNLKITFDKSLLTLSIETNDAELSASILNDLISEVNSHIRNSSIKEGNKSIFFLNNEIKKTNLAVSKQMLYGLIEQQTQIIMLANTRDEYAFKVIDPAVEPIHPAGPNRRSIVFLITFIGFIFALVLTLILNSYNKNLVKP